MAQTNHRAEPGAEHEAPMPNPLTSTPEDRRKPYEAPRLLKKRSVARATLFTVMGASMSGLVTHG